MTAIDQMVNDYVETFDSDTANPVPMATTDADEVIRSQLTENTGRHFLDSGSAYGRHWEENQETPPWEQPTWNVQESWVTHNVYDYLLQTCKRDTLAVSLETALYAYGLHGPGDGDAWLTVMEDFADALGDGSILRDELVELGVPESAAEDAAFGIDTRDDPNLTFNTYNDEWHSLSQCIQGVCFGGPYAEYAAIQVHGGCDIRGGYTTPRVYRNEYDTFFTGELSYYCNACDYSEAESVVGYEHEQFVWCPSVTVPDVEEALAERDIDVDDEEIEYAVAHHHNNYGDMQDGAVFHLCDNGALGHVQF